MGNKRLIKKIIFGVVLLVLILIGLTWAAGMVAKLDLTQQYPAPGRMVDIGGYRLHLHCMGHGKPTIVMDAGLNEFSVQWTEIQRALSVNYRACSYDRAGLGWSEASPHPRTSETMVKELHTLLEIAGVSGPYVLVGHSFGGMNMQLFAHRYPAETAGAVLVDSSHKDISDRLPGMQMAMQKLVEQFRSLAWLSSSGLLALSPDKTPDRGLSGLALDRYRAIVATTDYFDVAAAETEAFLKNLKEVRNANINTLGDIPLIVLSRGQPNPWLGMNDVEIEQFEKNWSEMQSGLVKLSPKARQVIAKDSKHYIHLTEPQLVIDAILSVASGRE